MSSPVSPETLAVGNAVRLLRQRQGWSQEEFAARCGMHRTYVGGIERGERNATVTSLYRLAHGLGLAESDLLRAAEGHALG